MYSDNVEHLDNLKLFLKALASETRQEILFLFAQCQELTVGQVAELVGIGQSTASENLSILKRAGIVNSRREGKTVFYMPNQAHMMHQVEQLKEYLETCCPSE